MKDKNDINGAEKVSPKTVANKINANEMKSDDPVSDEYNYYRYWRAQPDLIDFSLEEAVQMDIIKNEANDDPKNSSSREDISPEERKAESFRKTTNQIKMQSCKLQIKACDENENDASENEGNQFNAFQFWREPIINSDIPYQDSIMEPKEQQSLPRNKDEKIKEEKFNQDNTVNTIADALREQTTINNHSSTLLEETKALFSSFKNRFKRSPLKKSNQM